jgi:putative membrane protein
MPMSRKFAAAVMFLLAGSAAIAVSGHLQAAQEPASGANLPAQDLGFLNRAMQGAILQSELGKVAAVRAEDPQVREFAVLGVRSFGKAENSLRTLAQSLQVTLQPGVPQDVAALRRALAADSAPILDAEFVGQSLPANTVAVNLFSSEAAHGQNPLLVQFARDVLPQLEERQANLLRLTDDMSGLIAGAVPNPPMKLPEYQAPQNPTAEAEELGHG